jgi:hypothetical protein
MDRATFVPDDDTRTLVAAARIVIVGGNTDYDPEAWCAVAFGGERPGYYAEMLALHGRGFEDWFATQLPASEIEKAILDRAFVGAIGRALVNDAPNASMLKLWADIRGMTKDVAKPPQVPVISTAEGWEEIIKLGPDILEAARKLAADRETRRINGETKEDGAE